MQIPDSILESLEQEQKDAAVSILEKALAPCFSGSSEERPPSTQLSSRLGGTATLPRETGHPCDRSGKPMLFVAQINFSELHSPELDCAKSGLLILFCNAALNFSNPKDRNAFRSIWIPNPDEVSWVDSAFPESTIGPARQLKFVPSWSLPEDELYHGENTAQKNIIQQISNVLQNDRQIQLFGKAGREFDVLQEIAAFAGNGISWSSARRTDSCFSHLTESAKDWRLLLRMSSAPSIGLNIQESALYLLIRDEDLQDKNYGKAWLIAK